MTPEMTHAPIQVSDALADTLSELIALSLIGKQAHWTLSGPTFFGLHEGLDTLIDEWRTAFDEVAERSMALGDLPNGQEPDFTGIVPPLEVARLSGEQVANELVSRLDDVIERLTQRIDDIGEDDPVSQDLLIGISHGLAKNRWMLKSIVQ